MLVLLAFLLALGGGLILAFSWLVDVPMQLVIAAVAAIAIGVVAVGADAFVSARRARAPLSDALGQSIKEAFELLRDLL